MSKKLLVIDIQISPWKFVFSWEPKDIFPKLKLQRHFPKMETSRTNLKFQREARLCQMASQNLWKKAVDLHFLWSKNQKNIKFILKLTLIIVLIVWFDMFCLFSILWALCFCTFFSFFEETKSWGLLQMKWVHPPLVWKFVFKKAHNLKFGNSNNYFSTYQKKLKKNAVIIHNSELSFVCYSFFLK